VPSYRALTGLNYPPDKRVEAGDIVSDLPEKSIVWLLKDGFIEEVDKTAKKTTAPVAPKVSAPPPYIHEPEGDE
jgi:hypothetical protein